MQIGLQHSIYGTRCGFLLETGGCVFHIVILGKFVRFFVLQLKLAIEKYKKIYYGNKSMVRYKPKI